MTTETQVAQCSHDSRAVCFLCSDQVSWWRDARGGGDPPNTRQEPVAEPVAVKPDRHGEILTYIMQHPGCTTTDILTGVFTSRAVISDVTIKLRKEGLIKVIRSRNPRSHYAHLIYVSLVPLAIGSDVKMGA